MHLRLMAMFTLAVGLYGCGTSACERRSSIEKAVGLASGVTPVYREYRRDLQTGSRGHLFDVETFQFVLSRIYVPEGLSDDVLTQNLKHAAVEAFMGSEGEFSSVHATTEREAEDDENAGMLYFGPSSKRGPRGEKIRQKKDRWPTTWKTFVRIGPPQ